MKQDERHDAVLRLLRHNARLSTAEMAVRLELTAAEVTAAVAELEQAGVILGYQALVNEEKLGPVPVRALIEVEIRPERDGGFDHVAHRISKFPEVETVYLISGRCDLQLLVVGESLQEVAFFVASKLAPLEGVRSTATHFLLKRYKEAGVALHEDEVYERLKVVP